MCRRVKTGNTSSGNLGLSSLRANLYLHLFPYSAALLLQWMSANYV